MDEILFRLSNLLESFQIQASVTLQQCQQLFSVWLTESHRFLQHVSNDLHGQNFKDFLQHIFTWIHNQIEIIQYRFSHIRFDPRFIYHTLASLITLQASRREFIFLFTGVMFGTLIGYSVAINWNIPRHLHNMKAIVCHQYNGIEGVSMIEDAEMPTIQKSNELLIQVKAASIHEVDIKICSGYSRAYRRLLNSGRCKDVPVILGRDCSGVVIDIGQNVIDFDIGDNVFLAVPSWSSGTMAEYIVIPETRVAKMPKILPFEASASLPYSGCLAWDALVNRADMKEGNTKDKRVLIYGASSPVGCILIQLVKLWRGYVVAICRSEAVAVIKALGADEVILMNESDISKDLQLREKYDAIFHTGGEPINEKILTKHLSPFGSYVSTTPENLISDSLGYISGSLFSGCIRVRLLLQYVFGASTFHWKEGSKLNTAYLQSLQELADSDQLRPILDRVYAPHCIDQALSHIADSSSIGSTVIKFQ